jgi:tetratricopeptide (TPR) repeat protein
MDRRLLGCLISVALLCTAAARGEDYAEARRAAAMAVSSHQYAQALTLLEPLLKAHPQDPSLWTLRGLALGTPGNIKESLASFDKALTIDKVFLPALKGASQIAYLGGDAKASAYVERLLAVEPANEVANAMGAALAYQAKDCVKSIGYFEHSGDEAIRNEKALAEYTDCLVKQDRLGQAIQVLDHGLQVHPESVQIKYNLALVQLKSHDAKEAIRLLEPLAGQRDSQLLNLLASAYAKDSHPDDALKTLENAIEISPGDESNYLDLAVLCLEHNHEDRSIVAATAGIARIPNAASLFLIRGVAYAQISEYDKAESDFAAAAQIDPNKQHSTIAMSLLYSDRNQIDKEKVLLQQQLKATPNDAVANYLMADILIREGAEPGQPHFVEAKADLTRSLATRPDSAEAQILMGTLCQQENNLAEALEHIRLAIKNEPENPSALNHELLVLRALHKMSEASDIAKHLRSLLDSKVQEERPANDVRVAPGRVAN